MALVHDKNGEIDVLHEKNGEETKQENLPDSETKESEKKLPPVSVFKLFQYATPFEIMIMGVGALAAAATGLLLVVYIAVFGDSMDSLNQTDINGFQDTINDLALLFVYIGIINLGTAAIQVLCFTYTGQCQAQRIKKLYVESILRQDIGWFEINSPSELATRVNIAAFEVEDGIGRKFADLICFTAQFLGSFIYAFYAEWRISLVILATLPIISVAAWALSRETIKGDQEENDNYAKAGSVATEVFSSIRTVVSLIGERREIQRYDSCLKDAQRAGIKKKCKVGFLMGVVLGSESLMYALGMWYGLKLVADGVRNGCSFECEAGLVEEGCPSNCVSGGDILIALFCIVMGGYSTAQMNPGMTALETARGAAAVVFQTISRVPTIDTSSNEGLKPTIKGGIFFDNIQFSYPTRPNNLVCNGYSLSINPGETVALVGPSGGGKSTFMNLLLRFYDPHSGTVSVDGQNIRDFNLKHYRNQIGYVRQEPVLFPGTIKENILYGKPDASFEEVVDAAKQANAHDFILNFPEKYETQVGELGAQLSGGQKQRIAIARALLSAPPILLLDEATSALDRESENVVQQALDKLKQDKNRTTVIIAHRLSTIKDADKIAVIDGGKVVESGSHESLMAANGPYYELYSMHDGCTSTPQEDKDLNVVKESQIIVEPDHGKLLSSKDGDNEQNDDEADLENESKEMKNVPLLRIAKLMRPNAGYILLALLGAILAGGVQPATGCIMAYNIDTFYLYDADEMMKKAAFWSVAFALLGTCCCIGFTIVLSSLGLVGERLTKTLRLEAFSSIVRHDISWFDRLENSTGNLVTLLSEDCKKVHTAFGHLWGIQVQAFTSLVVGLVLSFFFSWRMALVVLATVPIMTAAMGIMMLTMTKGVGGNTCDDSPSGGILSMAVTSMDTVTAFNLQEELSQRYQEAEQEGLKGKAKKAIAAGMAAGVANTILFSVFGLLFWYTAVLIRKEQNTFREAMVVIFALMYAAFGVGQALAAAGDQNDAAKATKKIFHALDEVKNLEIDSFSEGGAKPENKLAGEIDFHEVHFSYPTRPDIAVYGGPKCPGGYTLRIKPGQTVALVGPSGSGKSTAMSLLLRFYTPQKGQIRLDGKDIRDYNIQWLRSQFGYVGQEPVLFAGSIKANIAYGNSSFQDEDVIAAAKVANAHSFIEDFEEKYNTDVGEKSALLSGGQKQRIAIARAVFRNPSVLLLDEATSALDNESEKAVQEALDKIQKDTKRTTLVIAHRLTTIQDADVIAVVKDGGIFEHGSHQDLMEKNGFYCELTQMNL